MPKLNEVTTQVQSATATVAASGTVSTEVSVYGATACVVQMPATITSTSMTFQGSIDDGSTFSVIKNASDNAVSYTISANGSYPLDPAVFVGYDKIKVVMGSAEAAERTIKVKGAAL